MEVAIGIVAAIVSKISERAFDAVFKGSLASSKHNIKRLRKQVEKLVAAKADLQNQIDEAELLKAEDVLENVRYWRTDADVMISEANTFLTKIEEEEKKKCSSFNLIQRRRSSKEAKNMEKQLALSLALGNFEHVACPAPLPPLIAKDYLSFESRETIMKDILEALQDPDIKMIGVYGMGGIGKTQLVINISNQVRKSFEHVLMATIGQIPNIKFIQGKLADMLRLKLDQETEQGRVALLLKRLHKRNILIVLDDVWDSLNLEQVGIPLAIVIVGKALQGEPLYTWRDALRQLKDLCSIFPDDHEIEIDELSRYAIGLKVIQGVDTLRIARDKFLTMVDHLESSYLVQKCKSKWSGCLVVKLHDIVRDVFILRQKMIKCVP